LSSQSQLGDRHHEMIAPGLSTVFGAFRLREKCTLHQRYQRGHHQEIPETCPLPGCQDLGVRIWADKMYFLSCRNREILWNVQLGRHLSGFRHLPFFFLGAIIHHLIMVYSRVQGRRTGILSVGSEPGGSAALTTFGFLFLPEVCPGSHHENHEFTIHEWYCI
jgi:hypothetical protein